MCGQQHHRRDKKPESLLTQYQRCGALRVARCHKTASGMAALVLARMPPAYLQAVERKSIAVIKKIGAVYSKPEQHRETIRRWLAVWNQTTKKTLTKVLIPDIERWWYQRPNSVSFHIAQALTKNRCFQKYFWSKAMAQNSPCVNCPVSVDTTEHSISECLFWDNERAEQWARSAGNPGRWTSGICYGVHHTRICRRTQNKERGSGRVPQKEDH